MAIDEIESVRLSLGRRAPARGAERVRVIGPREPGFRHALAELWSYRPFTRFFGTQLLRKRYRSTLLGWVWLPLRPTLNIGLKLLVFGGIAGFSSGKIPYAVFFLIASAAWQLFSEELYWSVRSLYVNRSTLRVLHIPRLSVIVASIIPSLIDFAIALMLGVGALLYYLVRAHTLYLDLHWWSPLTVLGGLALLVLVAMGLGLVGAVAGSRARDIRFVLGYLINILYYMTPVIYPFDSIPNAWKPLAELNPLVGAMELFKIGLFSTDAVSANALVVTGVAIVATWGPSLVLLHRQELRDW
jgi:lipopolysaccharide transport system permease protein